MQIYLFITAAVSLGFIGTGVYVVARRGLNPTTGTFLFWCVTLFLWQIARLAIVEQTDVFRAHVAARVAFMVAAAVPTVAYVFFAQLVNRPSDRLYIGFSAAIFALLAGLGLGTDLIVEGVRHHDFGKFPAAGLLHPLHLIHLYAVLLRCAYIVNQERQASDGIRRERLQRCLFAVALTPLLGIDFLSSYGIALPPFGTLFMLSAVVIIAMALTRLDISGPVDVAASVMHEMRTPLASIDMQADALMRLLPQLQRGYDIAREHGLLADDKDEGPTPHPAEKAKSVVLNIRQHVARSNMIMDMMLATAQAEKIDASQFVPVIASACVAEAISAYPFVRGEREKVTVDVARDFVFLGSQQFCMMMLFNLLKNALYAIRSAGKGEIIIGISRNEAAGTGLIIVRDTGAGIPAAVLPRIFDAYFTTKATGGAGIGLGFCRSVVKSFGGAISVESVEGEFAQFTISLPASRIPRV